MSRGDSVRRGLRRLGIGLALGWSVAWLSGIGVFSFVAIRLSRSAGSQDLDAELAIRATAVYGLTWFDADGRFHAEDLRLEEDLVHGPFDLWVLEPGDPPTVDYGPTQPRFPLHDLGALARAVVEEDRERSEDRIDANGRQIRWAALPTYGEDESAGPRAAVVVIGDRTDLLNSQRAFAWKIAGLALLLGCLGLGVGWFLARRSLGPVARALEERERFIDATAHELRTPLATLRAIADSALGGDEPPRAALERMAPIVESTGTMIEGLLLFARLDAGGADVRREPVRLDLLVEQVLAEEGDGELARLDSDPCVVEIDPTLVAVALRNLVENARLHGAGTGGMRVQVGAGWVSLDDGGPGFPGEILERSRGPFSVLPSTRGTGIGLATVKRIAELHGGTLRLENLPAGGARATLTLG